MDELLTMSVTQMAKAIRDGELSPVDAMDFFLARIEAVNPDINAVVVPRFEEARKEARAAADRLAGSKDDRPPLLGVPCTMKDTYAMTGLPWAGGLWRRRHLVPDFDATVVERIKQSGAIIMGKTNVPEAAMWCETYNHVYGRTNNPYDLKCGVGGSSGGEGAIIGSGASPFGMGSDVGGSIRYPAAFNGVPGHKPTGGRVSGHGHWPEAHGPVASYCTYGPLARRVEDLSLILSLVGGPDGRDPSVEDRPLLPLSKVDKKSLRVFYFDGNGMARTNADIRRAIGMCAGALKAEGLPVKYWRPSGMNQSLPIWQAGMSENAETFTEVLAHGEPLSLTKEMLLLMIRRSKYTFPGLITAITEIPSRLFSGLNKKSLVLAKDLRRRIEERLGDNGVLICPVFSTPAPRHHHIWIDLPGIGYSGVINILGFPATVIPVYYNEQGLPVSIQIVSSRWQDHLTLATAAILEQIFGGWQPPAKIGQGPA